MQTCCFICHQICMGSTETESFFGCASALAKRTSKHLRRRLFHALFVQLLETTCVFTGRNEVVAKVIFLHLSVILFTGGVCLNACWDTTPPRSRHPPGPDTPQEQTPPSQEQTPPREQTPPCPPPGADPPREQTPPREADSSIRSTSGRYASHWNAFLFSEWYLDRKDLLVSY